ncbi:hypothetical protein AUC68_08100 [Methyloceanibacter methanicus]|uniref:Uncharacterized protein n=1 Tax=Methyloceanibacter methanicus TaxID=1774968 RepID=A0A1E3VXW0_9HYPH|nr:hypothetical protein AUC68_08100 [Methyloceanibacter methanicus]
MDDKADKSELDSDLRDRLVAYDCERLKIAASWLDRWANGDHESLAVELGIEDQDEMFTSLPVLKKAVEFLAGSLETKRGG